MRKYIIRTIHFPIAIFLSLLLLPVYASEKKRDYLEKQMHVWDTLEGRTDVKVRTFSSNLGVVFSLDISRDGKYLITGSSRGIVRIWDLDTGVEKLTLDQCLRPGIRRVTFSRMVAALPW